MDKPMAMANDHHSAGIKQIKIFLTKPERTK
jgi:hypothetical protein